MKTGDNMKEHPQRLELRERIIDTALNSFATHGIKSITMDDIAAAYPNVLCMKFFLIKKPY